MKEINGCRKCKLLWWFEVRVSYQRFYMRILFTFFLIFISAISFGQTEIGGEYIRAIGKGYNASKVAVRGETFKEKNSYSTGITYQLASAKSYSVSRGFGIYFGYRYAFGNNVLGNNPFAGARVLISFENFEGQTRNNSILITPFAEAGYHFIFKKNYFAAPSIGYGYTFNFSKDFHSMDEDQGKRFIPSVSAGYRL